MAYLSLSYRLLHRRLHHSRASFPSNSSQHQKVFKYQRIQQVKSMTEYYVKHYLSNTSLCRICSIWKRYNRLNTQDIQQIHISPTRMRRTLRTNYCLTLRPPALYPRQGQPCSNGEPMSHTVPREVIRTVHKKTCFKFKRSCFDSVCQNTHNWTGWCFFYPL